MITSLLSMTFFNSLAKALAEESRIVKEGSRGLDVMNEADESICSVRSGFKDDSAAS